VYLSIIISCIIILMQHIANSCLAKTPRSTKSVIFEILKFPDKIVLSTKDRYSSRIDLKLISPYGNRVSFLSLALVSCKFSGIETALSLSPCLLRGLTFKPKTVTCFNVSQRIDKATIRDKRSIMCILFVAAVTSYKEKEIQRGFPRFGFLLHFHRNSALLHLIFFDLP
jgi:hypothetical protein